MKTNDFSPVSFNNEFRWKYVWQVLLYALSYVLYSAVVFFVMSWLICISIGLPLESYLSNLVWPIGIITILLLIYNALQYFPRIITGKYCIVGDNLIINEKYFSSKINLTIPISSITDVQRTSHVIGWNRFWKEKTTGYIVPFKFIEITVGEHRYLLYCVTYSKELYGELNKRIWENKKNN